MELNVTDIDTLRDIHDSLNGTSTLLLGLANYDGVEPDVKSAIDIIADILEADRAELQDMLRNSNAQQVEGRV